MDVDPIMTEARHARRLARLRGATACALCGEPDLAVLDPVGRGLLEAHHVSGVANDPDLTIALCCNCHRKLTEHQLRAGVDLRHVNRDDLMHMADTLYAQSIFFEDFVRSLQRMSNLCREIAVRPRTDRASSGWRSG